MNIKHEDMPSVAETATTVGSLGLIIHVENSYDISP